MAALVSLSVPIHLPQPQMRSSSMRSFSHMSTTSPVSSLDGIREERGETEEERTYALEVEKVYVAVGKEYKEGRETLFWVIQRILREKWKKIVLVLVHVHQPAKMIPMLGGQFLESQLSEEQVKGYRQYERYKTEKSIDVYMRLCAQWKVQAEKLVTYKCDIGKGLLDLIAEHGITDLVMGAAADRQYSRKMTVPKSKTAIIVQRQADPACKISFVCKGNLICTRDASQDESRISHFPASMSTRSTQSEPMTSTSLPEHENEMLRSISDNFEARNISVASSSSSSSSSSPLQRSISASVAASTSSSEEGDNESENRLMIFPSADESGYDRQSSTPSSRLEMDNGIELEVYQELDKAFKEAADSKCEAYQESCRRQKAERDAIAAARKAKTSENLYAKEVKQRKDTEITLEREKIELQKIKTQRDKVIEEVKKANEQKLIMEQKVTDSEQMIKGFEDELAEMRYLLSSLEEQRKELQQERDDAVREAEELRQMKDEATDRLMNFSEFAYSELERATNNFDDSLKIGEGGYGSVYKGFLRHTMVAIKLLKSESWQGQQEFYQEVDILTQVRHPHLIILIGKCSEACALVYEYLPQGSLEDRLVCKDNTPPLSWQTRTRIITEICSGIIFLHSHKPHCIVHGDIKPANVLLDKNLVSKLGDFGICRQIVQSDTTTTLRHVTNPRGTFAYMDPEFVNSGELTPRSDVFSFGVIILRMLTGKPAIGLIKEVKEVMERGGLHEILDVLAGDWPFVQAKQLAHLALRCCEFERKNRPDLAREVWRVLEPMMSGSTSLSYRHATGNNCVPSYFICPIFQEIMRDPHIAADGYTYEAEAFRGWLDGGQDTSPMTNLKLSNHHLIPNLSIRSAIQEWLQQHH